jgi:PAS domain S-box-containing protein
MPYRERAVHITRALETLRVPSAVIDRRGRIRWLNRGATDVIGDCVGRPFAPLIAPEDRHLARTYFAKKLVGETESTTSTLTLIARGGRRLRVRVSSVPFWEDGRIAGVFGIACPAHGGDTQQPAPDGAAPKLTARQYETLALLAEGLGTAEIAQRLGIADETARNHIRGLLGQLRVHSRLEAVVRAYRLGLVQPGRPD